MIIIEFLKSVLYGIVEGITEWLPVSSTGHLILLDEFLSLNVAPDLGARFSEEYWNMFEVVIQLGAILAVVVMFFGKLNPFSSKKSASEKKSTWVLWAKVCVGSIPAAVIGIVIDKVIEELSGKDIDGWLYNWQVVSAALIIYGILFIIIERLFKDKKYSVEGVDGISFSQAAVIGCFKFRKFAFSKSILVLEGKIRIDNECILTFGALAVIFPSAACRKTQKIVRSIISTRS